MNRLTAPAYSTSYLRHLPNRELYAKCLPCAMVHGFYNELKAWFNTFEQRVAAAVEQVKDSVSEKEAGSFYRLLGAFRGVSTAAIAYARTAKGIDRNQWREEMFS